MIGNDWNLCYLFSTFMLKESSKNYQKENLRIICLSLSLRETLLVVLHKHNRYKCIWIKNVFKNNMFIRTTRLPKNCCKSCSFKNFNQETGLVVKTVGKGYRWSTSDKDIEYYQILMNILLQRLFQSLLNEETKLTAIL